MLKCYFHIIYNLVTIYLMKFVLVSVKISSKVVPPLPGNRVNNLTTISVYGAEFYGDEVCQPCGDLHVLKDECTDLLLTSLQFLGPSFFCWLKPEKQESRKRNVCKIPLSVVLEFLHKSCSKACVFNNCSCSVSRNQWYVQVEFGFYRFFLSYILVKVCVDL